MANTDWIFTDLSQKIAKIQTDRDELGQRLTELSRLLEALELTRQLYRHNGNGKESNLHDTLVAELKERKIQTGQKDQMGAIVTIASRNGGDLKVNEAKKIMVEAELIDNPKNAASVVYALVSRSERFEWVATGQYRLEGTQQNLPGVR